MLNPTDMQTDYARLFHDIEGLDRSGQMVLELLSVFYGPVGRTKLQRALSMAGARTDTETLRIILAEFVRRGWVVEATGGSRCHPAIIEPVARRALAGGSFEGLAEIVKSVDAGAMITWENSFDRYMRALRMALYGKNWAESVRLLKDPSGFFHTIIPATSPWRAFSAIHSTRPWSASSPKTSCARR